MASAALAAAIASASAAQTPAPAIATPPPAGTDDDEARALALASYAFEYRDFARVVATLDPWVHPPRIADRARLAEAQRLLGVSLHIQGDVARAAEEFAGVLQHDPELRLDPFVVPPSVIDTFERVRTSMRPVLDRILAERRGVARVPTPTPPPPAARTLSPVFAYAPLGLSHFLALEEPGWGALWLGLQTVGLSVNVAGYWMAQSLHTSGGFTPVESLDAHARAEVIQLSGLAVFAAAWLASGLHAHAEWPSPEPTPATNPSAPTLRFE